MTEHTEKNERLKRLAASDDAVFDAGIREAVLEIKAPDDIIASTLDLIEEQRESENVVELVATPAVDAGISNRASRTPFKVIRAKSRLFALLSTAACFILIALVATVGYKTYTQPAAFVGIDINPSIELAVNCYDQVVAADALNSDAEAILDQVQLNGKNYHDALALLMESDAMLPYVSSESFVDISVFSEDASLAEKLQTQSDAVLVQLPCQSEFYEVNATTRAAAQASGMGMGRYRMASELIELDPSLTLDDCRHMTMRQIRDCIDNCRKGELTDEDSAERGVGNGDRSGSGYGAGNGGSETGSGYHHGQDADSGYGRGQHHGQ